MVVKNTLSDILLQVYLYIFKWIKKSYIYSKRKLEQVLAKIYLSATMNRKPHSKRIIQWAVYLVYQVF